MESVRAGLLKLVCGAGNFSKIWSVCGQLKFST